MNISKWVMSTVVLSVILINWFFDQQNDQKPAPLEKTAKQNTKQSLPEPQHLEQVQIKKSPDRKIRPPAPPGQKKNITDLTPKSTNVDQNTIKSYPIEDAEIYFVPPEQRYPGNLGGPPPLDLPDPDFL